MASRLSLEDHVGALQPVQRILHGLLGTLLAALAAMRNARVNGAEAARAYREQSAAADAAHQVHLEALEDAARGIKGAEARAKKAHERRMAALARAAEAQAKEEAARRSLQTEPASIHQLKETHWQEFADDAEAMAAEVHEAAEALVGPLRHYLHCWQQAAAKWSQLGPATQQRVLENDRSAGRSRDLNRVYEDAALPLCPIEYDALVKVLNVMPRPRFLNAGRRGRRCRDHRRSNALIAASR